MTARLVALMSTLLFLSLLAFILLVRQSEEAVMEEVGKTVSKVGLETVRAVMSHGVAKASPDGSGEGAPLAVVTAWNYRRTFAKAGSVSDDLESVDAELESGASPTAESVAAVGMRGVPGAIPDLLCPAPLHVIEEETPEGTRYRVLLQDPDAEESAGFRELVWASPDGSRPTDTDLRRAAMFHALLAGSGGTFGFSEILVPEVPIRVEPGDDGTMKVAIRLVATGSELGLSKAGLFGPGEEGHDDTFVVLGHSGGGPPAGLRPGVFVNLDVSEDGAATGQTVFQMSTRDYGAVFEALRSRMWALFVAVALVGTLLSAGLARRFTRPVRDLDTAIRRLGRDDLDVQVPERGGGEVGRLTHAFNEMARRLRIARERARELTRRERLSALGRLAAGVAHDVRNPLHSINLSLQHLQETCRPPDPCGAEFDRTVGIIRGEIRRLDGLVSNFLRFARSGAGERRPVEVDNLIRETGEVVAKEAAARGVEIRVLAESAGAEVLVEGDSVRSALLNLVLNSFQAMPSGGVVTLRSRVSDGVVILSVTDDGVGIPAANREQIFDFGFTSREEGHGLGLAMVHEIVVEEHDGRVEVESEEGVGTTIRLELPVATSVTAATLQIGEA